MKKPTYKDGTLAEYGDIINWDNRSPADLFLVVKKRNAGENSFDLVAMSDTFWMEECNYDDDKSFNTFATLVCKMPDIRKLIK